MAAITAFFKKVDASEAEWQREAAARKHHAAPPAAEAERRRQKQHGRSKKGGRLRKRVLQLMVTDEGQQRTDPTLG